MDASRGASSAGGSGPARSTGPGTPAGSAAGASGMDDGLITIRGMDSVAVAFIAIPSVREHQANMMQERLTGLADRTRGRLAVSLADVGDMTSAGLNALVAVHTRCKEMGGHLALFGLNRDIQKLLKVTKLERTLIVAETAHEAVRSFHEPPRRSIWKSAFTWARPDRDAA